MSSLRRIVPILALLAAVVLVAGCGGGGDESTAETSTENGSATSGRPALDPDTTYTVTMETSEGTFSFELDVENSPNTSASIASLVKKGFYDGLTFHRIVPGFVIQGGDPNGDGSGGAGYSVVDTPPSDAKYTKGVVAMAKTPQDPPGTSGSQFFVVTGEDIGLPPEYALAGNVTEGIEVVEKIDTFGDPADPEGKATKTVTIEKATVSEQ